MNRIIQIVIIAVIFTCNTLTSQAQKKVQTFTVTETIQASAEKVWAVVGEDYGAIAHSHPKIVQSDYINGTLQAGEGAERICYFNESGSRFLKEKQTSFDPDNYTFINQVFQAGKFPVDPAYTFAEYKVVPVDDQTSQFVFNMTFRTKPAFMGGLMKGTFKKLIRDYALAIEYYVNTGTPVNKDNFKDIKKLSS